MGLFRPLQRPDSIEDAFLERYGDLLRAALAITGGRREAEDLVQDAFVRLVLAQPDLTAIEHLDAYLRTVLRNLHTARLRRRAHRAETPLSVVDFDAAPFAARALTLSQWTQARHDVAAACRYACTRRLTSKTGSLFLLRFVHELVPNDIARVTRLTRATVDITLARARADVKAYLEQPVRTLNALGGGLVAMPLPPVEAGAEDDLDYLARIREAVFTLRHARCYDADHLQRLYASTPDSASSVAIPTPVLAELVTCPRCLDQVSRLTQVPPSDERHPGGEPPSQDTPRPLAPRDAGRSRRAAAAHACRAVRAHRPQVLRVFVNGFEVATHEISGAVARVTQTLSTLEAVWLVEVMSEQDVCLASLDVAPLPDAPPEQRVAVDLADDRRIEVALSFLRQWPTLHLVYEDPAYAAPAVAIAAEVATEIAEDEALARAEALAIAPVTPTRRLADFWERWAAWTPRRPPRLAWLAVTVAIFGWLFFFTPGTEVSAAERVWRALVSIVAREPTPTPMPRSGPVRQQDITLPPAPPTPRARPAASAPSPLTPTALAELEVDALTALHARHALVGQRIQVTRTPTAVAVEGLVEGQDRHDLVRALRGVPNGDALRVNLSTPADLLGTHPAGPSPSSSVRAVELDRDAVPAADDLRRALALRETGAAVNIEAEVHRIANDGLRYARTAFLEAATLSALADRFDAASASEMQDTTSRKWRTLLAEQTDRVARAVDQVRMLLEPVFVRYDGQTASRSSPGASSGAGSGAAPGSTPRSAATPVIEDPRQLADEAQRIAEDLRQMERATRAALAVAEVAPVTIELRDSAFWRRLAGTSDRIAGLRRQLIVR